MDVDASRRNGSNLGLTTRRIRTPAGSVQAFHEGDRNAIANAHGDSITALRYEIPITERILARPSTFG
jgi:hypothetical protein